MPHLGTINLHISFLPWNRGSDPNFWSHLEGTPKGVSIHFVDEGIDTGDILVQKTVNFSGADTLRTSYEKLHEEIQKLFAKMWPDFREGRLRAIKQLGKGTFHLIKDREPHEYLLKNKGWDTPIKELAKLGLGHIKIHKKIR